MNQHATEHGREQYKSNQEVVYNLYVDIHEPARLPEIGCWANISARVEVT